MSRDLNWVAACSGLQQYVESILIFHESGVPDVGPRLPPLFQWKLLLNMLLEEAYSRLIYI
jgi:hypothetical protein